MDNFCDLCQISQRLFCACITQVMLDVNVSIFIRRRARPHGVGFFDISRHVSAVCLRCCIYTFFHVMLDGIFVFFSFSVNWTAFRFKTSDFVQWVHLFYYLQSTSRLVNIGFVPVWNGFTAVFVLCVAKDHEGDGVVLQCGHTKLVVDVYSIIPRFKGKEKDRESYLVLCQRSITIPLWWLFQNSKVHIKNIGNNASR